MPFYSIARERLRISHPTAAATLFDKRVAVFFYSTNSDKKQSQMAFLDNPLRPNGMERYRRLTAGRAPPLLTF